jgi:hypothetical protein
MAPLWHHGKAMMARRGVRGDGAASSYVNGHVLEIDGRPDARGSRRQRLVESQSTVHWHTTRRCMTFNVIEYELFVVHRRDREP